MSTLLERLQDAAEYGEEVEAAAAAAMIAAMEHAAKALEIEANARFHQCQITAMQKLKQGRGRVEDGNHHVVVMSENLSRYTVNHRTPITDRVERMFNEQNIKTDRCYGGDELHTDCELILLIPVRS